MKKLIFSAALLLLFYLPAAATHLHGGHITYEYREGRTYTIILSGYSDAASPVSFGSNGILDFGGGRMVYHTRIPRFSTKEIIVPGKKLCGHYMAVIRQGK